MNPPRPDDDRVLPETRWAALAIFIIHVPAPAILWVAPGRTADLWAWPVEPELTATFLGSGYGAGAYFLWRCHRAERWHSSRPGVLGASTLTMQVGVGALMLSRDPRWSTRLPIMQTFHVATALLLIGAIRAFADFDASNPLTWLYLGGLTGTAGALALLRWSMERNEVGSIDPGGSRWPSPVS
jgi:hypothetical protein